MPIDWFDDRFIAEVAAEDRFPPPPAVVPLETECDDASHHAAFGELESPKTQELVRSIDGPYEAAGRSASRARNERICGRFRVISERRWIHYRPSAALASTALANLRGSQPLLQERLATHFYAADYERRLARNVADFPRWIDAVSRLAPP